MFFFLLFLFCFTFFSFKEGESFRTLIEPNERSDDVKSYVSQKDSATLAWLHFMREKEYTTSSNIATQEALHFNTDIPTATTLLSIAKLMSLQVTKRSGVEEEQEDERIDANTAIQQINAHLYLIELQKSTIFYHAIANKTEVGNKVQNDKLLSMGEALECHFNRLHQLQNDPMSEWNANVLTIHSPENKCDIAIKLITDCWDELDETMDLRENVLLQWNGLGNGQLSDAQLGDVLRSQMKYYNELVTKPGKLYLHRTVDAVVNALKTIFYNSIAHTMTAEDTGAFYVTVWKKCFEADVTMIQAIQKTNEMNVQQWNRLCEQSIFARSIEYVKEEQYKLNGQILNESYHQVSQEMAGQYGPDTLATIQKIYNKWSR